jgi:predicted metal-dependent hydrolase
MQTPAPPTPEVAPVEPPHRIVVRKMGLGFDDLPRWWLRDDPFGTHLVNGLHFVFPAGERFFIRSVRNYYTRLSRERKAEVAAFAAQEAEHQREHLACFEAIEAQGLDVQGFIQWYEKLMYEHVEPKVDPKVRLATTVALEHYTAVLGEFALTSDLLDGVHPVMRDLLKWHAAEEIEHKAVAFDVLQEIDPSYPLRVQGFAVASLGLFFFWGAGTLHMLRQEPWSHRLPTRQVLGYLLSRPFRTATRRWFDFLRPGFHPNDHDNLHLATDYLRSIGRLTH